MKQVEIENLSGDVEQIVPPSLAERVVLTRGGKPIAIVTGVGSLDDEDLGYIQSPDFWKMISERRKQSRISLDNAFGRLKAREAAETAARKD
jgi:hypothetical protein